MHRLILGILLAAFFVCGLALSEVFAQNPGRNDPSSGGGSNTRGGNHVIRGKIFLPSGQFPDQRMRVILELTSGGVYSETFSDSVGGFEFRNLGSNNYRIVVPSDGRNHEPAQENVEISGTISRTYTAQVYLRDKETDPRMTSKDKMISAAEMSQEVPKAAKKSYEQGLKKLKDGKNADAVALFQAALQVYPDYLMALNKLGEQQLQANQLAEAQATFERALKVSPRFPHTSINLGILMVQLKRFDEAVEYLESANNMDEGFPMAHLSLGIALLEKVPQDNKSLDRAELEFAKALALGGAQLAYVHKYIFNIHLRRRDYQKAAAELEAYLKDTPNAPDKPQVQDLIVKVKNASAQGQAPKQK